MRACAVEGCASLHHARGWCQKHYKRWRVAGDPLGSRPDFRNPLVCVCLTPDADPRRDFGMCHNPGCARKPLALMQVTS